MLQSQTVTPGFIRLKLVAFIDFSLAHSVIKVSRGGGFRAVLPPDVVRHECVYLVLYILWHEIREGQLSNPLLC